MGTKQNFIKAKKIFIELLFCNDTASLNGLGYIY